MEKKIFVSILLFFFFLFIFANLITRVPIDFFRDMLDFNRPAREKKAKLARQEFQEKYEINGPIKINGKFIYAKDCFGKPFQRQHCPGNAETQLVVSDVLEKNITVLKSFPVIKNEKYPYIYFPSPRGSYYMKLGEPSYSDAITGIIFDLNDNEIYTPPDPLHLVKWSDDERFLAQIIPTRNNPRVVVYDIQKKKKIFDQRLDNIQKSQVGDPYSTGPGIDWANESNVLYTFNEQGIKIISNFENYPSVKFIKTPVTCHGLAVKNNEFFCHSKMGTIFPGVENPAPSVYQASIFKYSLNGEELSGPIPVTLNGLALEGEYGAGLSFLDEKYLLFNPVLGSPVIIDTETGRIGETASYALRGLVDYSSDIPILLGNLRDDIPDFPVRYLDK